MSAMRREREHQGVFKAERRLGGRVGVQCVWGKANEEETKQVRINDIRMGLSPPSSQWTL